MLISNINDNQSEYKKQQISEISKIYLKYFFSKVNRNEQFGDLKKFDEIRGHSIEKHYGLFEGPFINLARTYWTFRLELFDSNFSSDSNIIYKQILKSFELDLGANFFPSAGPMIRIYSVFKNVQRYFLENYAEGIDIERFFSENPILKLIKRKSRNFLIKFFIFIFIIMMIIYLIFFHG